VSETIEPSPMLTTIGSLLVIACDAKSQTLSPLALVRRPILYMQNGGGMLSTRFCVLLHLAWSLSSKKCDLVRSSVQTRYMLWLWRIICF
jgi:hypothetical protein